MSPVPAEAGARAPAAPPLSAAGATPAPRSAAGATLSPMSAADLDEVAALEAVAFPTPWSRASFADELERAHARAFVLRRDAALIGYLVAWVLFDVAELLVVAVQPTERGHGHGRHLVTHLFDVARREGATRIQLEVRAGNTPAIALYERLGFHRVGLRPGYYQDNGEDAVLMDCELGA